MKFTQDQLEAIKELSYLHNGDRQMIADAFNMLEEEFVEIETREVKLAIQAGLVKKKQEFNNNVDAVAKEGNGTAIRLQSDVLNAERNKKSAVVKPTATSPLPPSAIALNISMLDEYEEDFSPTKDVKYSYSGTYEDPNFPDPIAKNFTGEVPVDVEYEKEIAKKFGGLTPKNYEVPTELEDDIGDYFPNIKK